MRACIGAPLSVAHVAHHGRAANHPAAPSYAADIAGEIDSIWNDFWSGGVSNPLSVIEQITYLLPQSRATGRFADGGLGVRGFRRGQHGFLQFSILHPCFVPRYRRVLRNPDRDRSSCIPRSMVLRARPAAIEVAETPPSRASMARAVPPIEICGVAKVAADGTERCGATFFGQRAFSLQQCSKAISKNGFRRIAVFAYQIVSLSACPSHRIRGAVALV